MVTLITAGILTHSLAYTPQTSSLNDFHPRTFRVIPERQRVIFFIRRFHCRYYQRRTRGYNCRRREPRRDPRIRQTVQNTTTIIGTNSDPSRSGAECYRRTVLQSVSNLSVSSFIEFQLVRLNDKRWRHLAPEGMPIYSRYPAVTRDGVDVIIFRD